MHCCRGTGIHHPRSPPYSAVTSLPCCRVAPSINHTRGESAPLTCSINLHAEGLPRRCYDVLAAWQSQMPPPVGNVMPSGPYASRQASADRRFTDAFAYLQGLEVSASFTMFRAETDLRHVTHWKCSAARAGTGSYPFTCPICGRGRDTQKAVACGGFSFKGEAYCDRIAKGTPHRHGEFANAISN
jgi:hypothetical protein